MVDRLGIGIIISKVLKATVQLQLCNLFHFLLSCLEIAIVVHSVVKQMGKNVAKNFEIVKLFCKKILICCLV